MERSIHESGRSKGHERKCINAGEDDEMEITCYRVSKLKLALVWIGFFLTLFFLKLIFWRRKDWEVKCTGSRCSVLEADWVILEDKYLQCFSHKIYTKITSKKAESEISEASGDSVNGVEQRNEHSAMDVDDAWTLSHSSSATETQRIERYFLHQKLKYVFNEENGLFEKMSVPPLRCSYFLSTKGLTLTEQEGRRKTFGENATRIHMTPVIVILFTQALNPFYLYQLFTILQWSIADAYYFYCACVALMSIVSLTAQIVQQRITERTLKKTISYNRTCQVWRVDLNEWLEVTSESLVPGDVIQIPEASGSILSCDVVLTSGICIMNESMLTGESVPVTKVPIQPSANDSYFDIKEHVRHVIFSGTSVVQIRSTENDEVVRGVVYRTGFSTAKGNLVRSILYPRPMDFKFTRDSYKFFAVVFAVAMFGVIYSVTARILDGYDSVQIFVRCLEFMTSGMPPLLPAVMTLGIAIVQYRLKKSRIFCITPKYITACGSLDTFCFDKTGTLTEDGLDFLSIRQVTHRRFDNDIFVNQVGKGEGLNRDHHPVNHDVISAMATCHSLALIDGKLSGDPLDVKLFEFTNWMLEATTPGSNRLAASTIVHPKETTGCFHSSSSAQHSTSSSSSSEIGIMKQFTFSSKLQRMSVTTRQQLEDGSDRFVVFVKGSPEMITSLSRADSVPADFDDILIGYTSQGYRVIALAKKTLCDGVAEDNISDVLTRIKQITREEVECDLEFLGLAVMENRLKVETTPVIHQLRSANIRTIMVTGDNMLTAMSVANACGMLDQRDHVIVVSVSSEELDHPSEVLWCSVKLPGISNTTSTKGDIEAVDKEIGRRVFAITGKSWALLKQHHPKLLPKVVVRGVVFARFSPDQKKQLIEELQSIGYFVGMCGDGANDCGALKTAHAGISLSDTEASVASPFTSKDPNIACVSSLLREGRASLVTSFELFKFMAGYSMNVLVAICFLAWPSIGTIYTDFQYLYVDLFLMGTLLLTFCLTGPCSSLSTRRPMISLFTMTPIASVMCLICLNVGVVIFAYYFTLAQPWYETVDARDGSIFVNYDQTVIYLITIPQYITMGIIYAKGHPYRGSIFSNRVYFINLLIGAATTIIMIFNRWTC